MRRFGFKQDQVEPQDIPEKIIGAPGKPWNPYTNGPHMIQLPSYLHALLKEGSMSYPGVSVLLVEEESESFWGTIFSGEAKANACTRESAALAY